MSLPVTLKISRLLKYRPSAQFVDKCLNYSSAQSEPEVEKETHFGFKTIKESEKAKEGMFTISLTVAIGTSL